MSEIRGCAFPDDLFYDNDLNLWFRQIESATFEVGITTFGHALSGDLYMFNPKPLGRFIESQRAFALVEAAKTVLAVRTPFDATIIDTNSALQLNPVMINRDPFGNWLVRLKASDHQAPSRVLLQGDQVGLRANALMDLYSFESLDTFAKGSAG